MVHSERSAPRVASATTYILLKGFPVGLHREMKAEAARRGIYVSAVYAAACQAFLAQVEQRQRRKAP